MKTVALLPVSSSVPITAFGKKLHAALEGIGGVAKAGLPVRRTEKLALEDGSDGMEGRGRSLVR